MKKTFYAAALAFLGLGMSTHALAQSQCASMEVLDRQLAADPGLARRLQSIEAHTEQFKASATAQRSTTLTGTIPVVVHVLYSTSSENVSDAQIQSQIDVLNEDFRKLNADVSNTPAAFADRVADVGLQFVLARRDPSGNATTGIERKPSTITAWGTSDAMKSTSTGGLNAWPADQYLNLWVCNIGGTTLGYAQFPGGPASTDGVVVTSAHFGRGGSAVAPFNLGRIATHEVGHWLNLRHIWGDDNCGDDLVDDTPTQQTSNSGCPAFPHITCSNGPSGDMFMNYMDYTNNACMVMFSNGQSTRMNALFAAGGSRASLLTSLGGTAPGEGYCVSQGTNASYEWIDLVSLGAIDRTSGSDAGYYNGTATSTSVALGSSQTISYSAGFATSAYNENWKIYIDYNQDGDFTDSDELVASNLSSASATLSSSFTIPATALPGTTRLRVVMSYDNTTTSCGSFSYGETEDYALTITPSLPSYCASQGTSTNYEWIGLVSLGAINRTSGSDGGYYDGTATSTSVAAGSSQTISHSPGFASSTYPENWKIYIDYNQDGDFTDSDELVVDRLSNDGATLSSSFTVPATALPGTTRLRVVMSYENNVTSCGSFSYGETEDYALTITGGSTRTSAYLASTDYGLYPNPATNVLTIRVPTGHDAAKLGVRVYDVRGAEQPQARYSGEGKLDVSGLSKGVYLLTITDGRHVSHQRFVKE